VIQDIDNLKAIIKKPNDIPKNNEVKERYYYNGNTDKEENGEQVNEISTSQQKVIKRNLSDYRKVYKPATKVKKINDNIGDIEIYFSEKSEKDFFTKENGKFFQEDEFDTNLNFERNSSKTRFRTMMIVRFSKLKILLLFN